MSTAVCRIDDLTPERGVAALIDDHQVAVFRIDDPSGPRVFVLDHHDPLASANVLARGIVGSTSGSWYVSSPIHKHRYALDSGVCLDDPQTTVRTWTASIVDGIVHVNGG